MKVKIENAYSDGHESEKVVRIIHLEPTIDSDTGELLTWAGEDWWEIEVRAHTGDGHGDGSHGKLGYCHIATIVQAANPKLVGQSHEWSGI